MIEYRKIILRLKWILEAKKRKKATFKALANELGINPLSFSTMMHRHKIPFKEVLIFCKKYRVDVNWLFFDDKYQKNCIKDLK